VSFRFPSVEAQLLLKNSFMQKYFIPALLIVVYSGLFTGCTASVFRGAKKQTPAAERLHIGKLIALAYQASHKLEEDESFRLLSPPPYLDKLLADGRLTIGLGVGTSDLGKVVVSPEDSARFSSVAYVILNKKIIIESRLILSRDDFQKALTECEIIFVASHSRFGAGPAFLIDGKANPYRMQRTAGYGITMSEDEVAGYQGTINKSYDGFLKQKKYFDFEPDSTDLDRAVPYPGYQFLVLSTCSSEKHFLDELEWLRRGYSTTAVLTTKACGVDPLFRPFTRLLYTVFQGKKIDEVVEAMNREYVSVAWENVKKHNPPWSVVEGMYKIGIHNIY